MASYHATILVLCTNCIGCSNIVITFDCIVCIWQLHSFSKNCWLFAFDNVSTGWSALPHNFPNIHLDPIVASRHQASLATYMHQATIQLSLTTFNCWATTVDALVCALVCWLAALATCLDTPVGCPINSGWNAWLIYIIPSHSLAAKGVSLWLLGNT